MNNLKLKYLTFSFFLFTFALSFGCAKTVTNVNFGSTMTVTVTLRGNADVSLNRYFLVLSASPGTVFKVPLPPPNNVVNETYFEFLEPDGTLPKDGTTLEAYYTNYFSTWSGYIMLDSGGYFLVPGPFSLGGAITRSSLALYTPGSNKLSFNFQLSRLFASGVPATAYFDFVAVPWPPADKKFPADHLESTNASVSTLSGSLQTVNDQADISLDAAQDILTCEVMVQ